MNILRIKYIFEVTKKSIHTFNKLLAEKAEITCGLVYDEQGICFLESIQVGVTNKRSS